MALILGFQAFVIAVGMGQGPAHAATDELIEGAVQGAANQSPFGEGRPEIADGGQFLPNPAFPQGRRISFQHRRRQILARLVAGPDGIEGRLGRQHAGLDGIMAALDLGHVHEPGAAPDQGAAGKDQTGDGFQPAGLLHADGHLHAPVRPVDVHDQAHVATLDLFKEQGLAATIRMHRIEVLCVARRDSRGFKCLSGRHGGGNQQGRHRFLDAAQLPCCFQAFQKGAEPISQ